MRFINVNDLTLTQVELFSSFQFMRVVAHASELLNIKFYLYVNSLASADKKQLKLEKEMSEIFSR